MIGKKIGDGYPQMKRLTYCATCSTILFMRKAGVREARQNISELIEVVRKGREILITDRGRPVARLVPAGRLNARPYPGRAAFRGSMPALNPPLSLTINEDREDRI
jgi:prevent-host-death family protein